MARNKQGKSSAAKAFGTPAPGGARGFLRRVVKWLLVLVAVLVALPLILTPVYKFFNPPISALMVWRLFGGAAIDYRWRDYEDISPVLPATILMSEDGQFCSHAGVDWGAVQEVLDDIEAGRAARGASTISMQVVKNLFLWPSRSYVRKFLEVPLAYYADFILGKRRVMEIYLNIVEWEAGVYGAEAAAQNHFNKGADHLTRRDAARLAAVLPNPRERSASNPGSQTRRIARRAEARGRASGQWTTCLE
jgi:monofunctional glycosyltransferase